MNEGEKTYTRSGVRRAGDDYQDAVALDLLVSMLEHPDHYDWIRVEADDFGYLDDVVAMRKDGTVEAKQVKFSAHPEDADDHYEWNDLTETRKGKDGTELPSLVGKWGPTLLDLLDRFDKVDAVLVTNRRAAPELARCIDEATDRVCPERVPPVVMAELDRQLGDNQKAIRFLGSFDFRMDRPGLATWETGIHERFKALGGRQEGWLNLKDCLRGWAREKSQPAPDGRIRLMDVQRAALWRRLEALPQGVSIPDDYVLPSTTMHQSILGRLLAKIGDCLVISGTPGVGKSTYLSYLHHELRAHDRPVVRHHYFLSLSDNTVGRFDHSRVIESLMADLRTVAAEALGTFDASNPSAAQFQKWLDACSLYYSEQEYPLVIVVDGLDHVWRERQDTTELIKLFENLLPCRPGICLVVGTQPLGDANLPKRLLDAAPRDKWITLPSLDRQAVLEWTRKNESRFEFRQNTLPNGREDEIRDIANAFFDVSQGQPLLLRYGLSALIESSIAVDARSVREQISVASGNITDYYRSLWNGLGIEGRFILYMIASSGFEWPYDGIISCCAKNGISRLDAERSWQQVIHMMCRVPLGWRPFHSSLAVFVTGMPEYAVRLQEVRPVVASWLSNDAPDYWRWAYEWTVCADMGNLQPLLTGTTRAWAVNSLAKGYPHSQVCALVGQAAKRALAVGDLQGFAYKALLFEYINDTFHLTDWDAQDEWTCAQLTCGFVDRLPDVLFSQRKELTDLQLTKLANALKSIGDGQAVAVIYDELIDRINTRTRTGGTNDWISEVTPIIWTESLIESFDAKRIAERIKKNRNQVDSVQFSRVHAEALRAHKRADLLRQLCDADLLDEERDQFLKQGFLLALEEGADWSDMAHQHSKGVFSSIYARVRNFPGFAVISFSLPDPQALSMRAHEFSTRKVAAEAWLDRCFYAMLSHYLWDRRQSVDEWLIGVGTHSWQRIFVQQLAIVTMEVAGAIQEKRHYSLAQFYKPFSELAQPKFSGRDEEYDFWQVARRALVELGLDSLLMTANTSTPCVRRDGLEFVFNPSHCYWADWIRRYVERRRLWLEGDALEWITDKYGDYSDESIEDIARDGVAEASILANLTAMHGMQEHSLGFLQRAVDLTITYGNRKDILLHDYVETVELLGDQLPEHGRQEIRPVISAILHVHEFTDGKETRHVPGMLFDLLTTLAPKWLPPIYQYLCQAEEYHNAADAFCGIIKSLPFVSEMENALGSTCLNQAGLKSISEKVDQGSSGARETLDLIRQFIGETPFPAREKEDEKQTSIPSFAERSLPPIVSDYPPERIMEYWKAVRKHSYGRGTKEIKEWAEHWGQNTSLDFVRVALESLYDVGEYAEVANIIYDIIVRLKGRSQAWPWLVKAHREIHGWSAHWASKDDALLKWELVKRYYPERWLVFIVETMAPDRWSSDGIGIHGRFPRLIEYLLLLGKESEAISVLQSVREMIEALVSPFGLKPADWLIDENSRDVQLLNVLLARLTWPSGMVRERACNALAKLLADSRVAERVTKALIDWISDQTLESVVCYGVLPFIRAKQLDAKTPVPTVEQLRGICPCPSLLYEILLSELSPASRRTLAPGIGFSGTAPGDYQPCSKFMEHYDHALPTIYREKAESISRTFAVTFQRQWAYEVEHTGDGLKGAHVDMQFWGRSDGEHFVAFDCPLSEGLRSGYLRALAWLAEQGKEQRFWAIAETLRTLPIDLGLWQVSPVARPDWWPMLESPTKADVDTVPATVFGILDSRLTHQQNDDWTLGMASGRVAEGGAIYDLDVFGIFQKCLGPKMPEAEEVWQAKPWYKKSVFLDQVSPKFSGKPIESREAPTVIRLEDWAICPCVRAASPYVVPRWQWWRFLRGIWLPFPAIATNNSYQVNCEQGRISFHDEQEELGFWQDWTAGVSEMQDASLTPRTGQVLMLRRSAVQQYAAANAMTFCWVCRISGFQKDRGFGNHDEFNVYQIIGGSRLVL